MFKIIEKNKFIKKYNLNVKGSACDFFQSLLSAIDDSDRISYFSASLCPEDVLADIQEEAEVASKLNIDCIEVDGVYIAIY